MFNIGERGSGVRRKPAEFLQNFDELRTQCLKQNILFIDPEFDTYDLSVHYKNLQKNQLEWRRPKVSILYFIYVYFTKIVTSTEIMGPPTIMLGGANNSLK